MSDAARLERLHRRAEELVAREMEVYRERTPKSRAAAERAAKAMPLGVASSMQFFEPNPVFVARAQESWMEDVDGNHYVDFLMGFGALLAGHCHPVLVETVQRQLELGTLYTAASTIAPQTAEALKGRFGMDAFRFVSSGTESTLDAVRLARAVTGRSKVVKVEGGYHGHHDGVLISMKPDPALAGDARFPATLSSSAGVAQSVLDEVRVVQYNDAPALEEVLKGGDIAAFIVEPVMQNIGIVLPNDGYLAEVREITRKYGTMLIFDEVKTGITAGPGGATKLYGVQPDIICLAKSIGGGLPVGALGGTDEAMEPIRELKMMQLGTYNGNPLVMAGALAVLNEICTPEAVAGAEALNHKKIAALDAVIDRYDLPAHTVALGAKGCITWSREPVRNYRDYKRTDFALAYAQWLYTTNRGVLLPPGLDEQWLVSIRHTEADVMHHVDAIEDFAKELVA